VNGDVVVPPPIAPCRRTMPPVTRAAAGRETYAELVQGGFSERTVVLASMSNDTPSSEVKHCAAATLPASG
jgi:hypothetical protein